MIKLTKEQDELLKVFMIDDDYLKQSVITLLYNSGGKLDKTFNTDELKLKAIQAILDGEWEVEEQLYYVKLVDKEFGYLNQNIDDLRLTVSNKNQTRDWKSKFTRAEVKAIDPRYLEFLEEVE